MPQVELLGSGTIGSLPRLLENLNLRSIFLVHGRSSFSESGLEARITSMLLPSKITAWSGFRTNPDVADLEQGLERFRGSGCDGLVSIGGGSVMDMAKLLKYFSTPSSRPDSLLRSGLTPERIGGMPHIAVPTTAGSGSEATSFAVIYLDGVKYSVADVRILPEAAIVDPELTMSLPAAQTAASGMDALCQAIESYWSVHSTDASRAFAAEAVALALAHLPRAVGSPTIEHRTAMATAAHLAGKAINITKTTAPHAISYTLTARYRIPHGHAVALTLGELLAYNSRVSTADVVDPRGVEFVRARIGEVNRMLGAGSAEEARRVIAALMRRVGLETRLDRLGAGSDGDIRTIVEGVNIERLANNPRRLTSDALTEMLERLRGGPEDSSR